MSDMEEIEGATKKGGGKKKLVLLLAGVLLLLGGGVAAGFYAAGSMTEKEGPKIDARKPQLVLKGEKAEDVASKWSALAAEQAAEGEHKAPTKAAAKAVDLPRPANPSLYESTYFQIPAPFTTNLSDSDAFAQISIAVSTYYDHRVIQAVQTHELAIRSAILMMMAQEQEIDLSTPQGKEALQARLVKVINDTLKAKTGFGGVDNVYFTNFVIQ
jgi:flagellar FliL protein